MLKEGIEEMVISYILACGVETLRELTLEGLAAHFDMSRSSLNTKFKNKMGISPGKYILREKMMRAAFIIQLERKLRIKEVTERLGFCSCDYFIRVFKEYFGLTPKKYRDATCKDKSKE